MVINSLDPDSAVSGRTYWACHLSFIRANGKIASYRYPTKVVAKRNDSGFTRFYTIDESNENGIGNSLFSSYWADGWYLTDTEEESIEVFNSCLSRQKRKVLDKAEDIARRLDRMKVTDSPCFLIQKEDDKQKGETKN